ncbi:MAG: nucleotidyl transferase [Desulfurococcales archaeon ex4484_217_1]|nr:MAG: nucleotidyl transferase [Desulfurococcales archaeon ex4484_217_1]
MKTAVVLAAGKGERLQPFTYTKPKPLIPILNKPFISYILDNIIACGIEKIVLVVHYLKEKVMDYVKKEYGNKANIVFVDQGKPLGTGHAVKVLENMLSEPFLLIYGDVYVNREVLRKILLHAKDHENVLVGVPVENPWDYGVLILRDGLLKGIVEKPEKGKEPSNIINAGIYVLATEIFGFLSRTRISPRGEIELTDAVTELARKGRVKVVLIERNEWFELGKVWDILELNKIMLGKIRESKIEGVVEGNVNIKGKVIIGKNTIIRSGTCIEGPVFIGENCSIGPNSYIRPYTVLGNHVKIGASCEIKASTIMNHTHIPHLSYVGDSVIGEHVNFGAGTITANLRLDDKTVKVTLKGRRIDSGRRKLGAFVGDYVKTGINVSLMPGVKIGPYTWIAPGLVIYEDIPPYSFVKPVGKRSYIVEKLVIKND